MKTNLNRRDFLTTCFASLSLGTLAGSVLTGCDDAGIITVNGPIRPDDLGLTLSHEHIMVDFVPVDQQTPNRYLRSEVFEVVKPYLDRIQKLGCNTFFDFTPAYLGRDPLLLKQLSDATGLHIITNIGYYGARDDRFIPAHAHTDSVDELAARWLKEATEGIDETGIRPGFMKIGVDPGPLSELDQKLVRAAARVHKATGLTIAVHTGPAVPAFEQMDILEEEGVHPSAWVWVHAQAEQDMSRHAEAARRGAWVAFDGINQDSLQRHVELVRNMKSNGLLNHVLVSQDAGWYSVGEQGGGSFRDYDLILTDFLPALRDAGLTEQDVDQLVRINPAAAFTVRFRSSTRSANQ